MSTIFVAIADEKHRLTIDGHMPLLSQFLLAIQQEPLRPTQQIDNQPLVIDLKNEKELTGSGRAPTTER